MISGGLFFCDKACVYFFKKNKNKSDEMNIFER